MPPATLNPTIARSLQSVAPGVSPEAGDARRSPPGDHASTIAEECMASGARWEWRTFGAGAEAGAPAFEGRPPTGTADSDERYLLSAGGTTVKIRDGLMDVKALLAVDGNGLQQWRPVLKVGFPIDEEAVRAVWEALRLPAPVLARETYTAEQLEAELTGPGTGVRTVAVHKHRVRYLIDGC